MIGVLFVSVSNISGTLLTAKHNLKQLNILAASTVLTNVVLNLWLIPRYQAYGAAIASLASQSFYALLQLALSNRLIKIPLNRDILLRLGGFLILNLGIGYGTLLIPGWIPGFLVLLASCGVTSLLLGLIKPSEIRLILRSE
jgi:O-antigen/teichoic acid export membrane protein